MDAEQMDDALSEIACQLNCHPDHCGPEDIIAAIQRLQARNDRLEEALKDTASRAHAVLAAA